jgi:citronellol/citronellal dehydrogenase
MVQLYRLNWFLHFALAGEPHDMSLKDKVLFITGASRGIGLAIALRAARDGASIAIAAKTVVDHAKLPGTIFSAAKDIEAAGGQALALECDIRNEDQVKEAIAKCVSLFGQIDVLVNNASAISLTPSEQTEMKRYDLMHQVNARGTFMCSKYAIPHLAKQNNPHILNLSPPLNLNPRWFAPHCAYTMAKYGMSMCTLGMSAELKDKGIAVNSLWPETAIATAAVQNLLGGEQAMQACRTPDIVADAAHWILTQPAKACTGNFFIDTDVLGKAGVTDLEHYAVTPGGKLMRDFFLD